MNEIDQLRQTIEALEAQRANLGDAIVDTALGPLYEKLLSLQPQTAEQRKMVTVLFADLVGFTGMSARLDPEDVREILNAYFRRWAACIEAQRGLVEKYIGDAVMAVFGLPIAQEDDPESAILAALNMRTQLEQLNSELAQTYGLQLAMRVGIHTGPVVVSFLGERKGQDFVVVGDTVNLASRLQSAAPENGILITHDTYRHVRGLIAVQAREPIQVKGVAAPVRAYLVEFAKQHAFRLPNRGVEGIETRTIGRKAEIEHLKQIYTAAAQDGKHHFVTVVGEAGIGKSRLLDEFDSWLELLPDRVRYFKGRASPAMQNQAYSLLRDLFSSRFRIPDSDPPQVVREKMEAGFHLAYPPESQVAEDIVLRQAHFVGQLLGFDFHNSPYLGAAGEAGGTRQLRDQALACLLAYFLALASQNPVVLLLEDLHWADDSSLEAVNQLAQALSERQEPVRLLIVGTARPSLFERRPQWGASLAGGTRLDLLPLSRLESHQLVSEILHKVPDLPDGLRELVVTNAEGNPFYIEELIKMFIEDGIILKGEDHWHIAEGRLANVRVPPTLTGVLQARIDSLKAEERGLIQHASVIGKVFWDEAVRQPDWVDPDSIASNLEMPLAALDRREIIFQREVSAFEGTREFQFKHSLMCDVTYESVLKRERRIYHAHAARWLVQVTARSQRTEEYAARIADHFDRAGEAAEAGHWYRQAGLAAANRYANAEAVRLLIRGMELTPADALTIRFETLKSRELAYDMLGARHEQRQDLEDLLALASTLNAVDLQCYAHLRWASMAIATAESDESRRHAIQAVALAQQTGDLTLQAQAYLQLGAVTWHVSDYAGARPHLEQGLTLARRAEKPNLEAEAMRQLGIVMEAQGEYLEAHDYFAQAYQIMRRLKDRRGEGRALNSLGIIAYNLQDFQTAMDYLKQSLQIKQEIGDRHGQNASYHNLGLVAYGLGDLVAARAYQEQDLKISREISDINGQGEALTSLGQVSLQLGDHDQAYEELEAAVEIYRQIVDPQGLSDALSYLGLLSQHQGSLEAALRYCQEANQLADDVGHWEQMAHSRVFLGHILAELGRYEEATGFYRRMIAMENAPQGNNLVYEAWAGLLRVALAQGDLDSVHTLAADLWAYLLSGDGTSKPLEGMDNPFHVYLSVYQGLQATSDPRALTVLSQGYRLLMQRAARLPAGAVRANYLETIPAHRELLDLYQRLAASLDEHLR